MTNFERAFAVVVGHEGVYSTDPADRGNWTGGEPGRGELKGTKYGISAKAYPHLDIAGLTLDDARAIYARDYWRPLRCDEMPWAVALAVFDAGVNSGVPTSARWLQAALGVAVDGQLGPRTMGALASRDPFDLAAELLARRGHAMAAMPTFGVHGLGWYRRVMRLAFQSASG